MKFLRKLILPVIFAVLAIAYVKFLQSYGAVPSTWTWFLIGFVSGGIYFVSNDSSPNSIVNYFKKRFKGNYSVLIASVIFSGLGFAYLKFLEHQYTITAPFWSYLFFVGVVPFCAYKVLRFKNT